jgi:hypothetical protein
MLNSTRTAQTWRRSTYVPGQDNKERDTDPPVQRDHSMLTFEANGTLGAQAIVEKLQVRILASDNEAPD